MYETTELEALQQTVKRREDEIARRDMIITHPTYSINRYDDEGYSYDDGIFLHFGAIIIKVGRNINDLDTMITQLGKCREAIEKYHNDELEKC